MAKPDHHYGPGARSGYMLHLILSGKGTFISNGQVYHLQAGNMFYCQPGVLVNMIADHTDPWTTMWIRFTGDYVTLLMDTVALVDDSPVFTVTQAPIVKDEMENILKMSRLEHTQDLHYASQLISLITALRATFNHKTSINANPKKILILKATQYIRNNYDTPITITDVVTYLGIDRTYLFRIFKTYLQISPKVYLTNTRLRAAKEMLIKSDTSIKFIALSCGYTSYVHFSKAFRKHVGVAPSQFKNVHSNSSSKHNY
ncbi:AraC family transcriptional regulator [Leuconostoc rapi]|uniref:AraC family transcriptional regulator n=1 Tax=Leuconostoc rapi TaxID=1406906 RepID=UPI0021806986|nr:AraC family transcriptional regulator [Leuconostoc rapi]